jgi:iron complex transport system substrate-binding protein
MVRKLTSWVLIFAILISLLTGCTQKAAVEKREVSKIKTQSTTFTFKDDLNRQISLNVPVKSVVSMAPSFTEIIFELGAGKKLKGVTNFCNYPEEAKKIQKIGDFFNPNVELIVSLKPEVVFSVKGIQENTVNALEKNGIKVVVLEATSLEDLAKDIELVGKIIGSEKKAKEIASAIRDAKTKYAPTGKKVFIEINHQPLMTAGRNSFLSDAIKAAGGINVGDQFGDGYPMVNPEKLLETDVDVYLISKSLGVKPDDVAKFQGLERLSAVKNNRVYVIPDDDLIQRPGPRIIQGIQMIHELLTK